MSSSGYRLATAERAELASLMETSGPDAATLCGGWQARELMAHLLVRERKPHAAAGILFSPLAGLTNRAMRGLAEISWATQCRWLREGPPRPSPMALPAMDRLVNGVELFIHHEDLRRGEPGWHPRGPHPERDHAVWKAATASGKLLLRASPVGVLLRDSVAGHGGFALRPGPDPVTLVGAPSELLLFAFGRDAVAISLEGSDAGVAALHSVKRGL